MCRHRIARCPRFRRDAPISGARRRAEAAQPSGNTPEFLQSAANVMARALPFDHHMRRRSRQVRGVSVVSLLVLLSASAVRAQPPEDSPPQAQAAALPSTATGSRRRRPRSSARRATSERVHCDADTSAGVALVQIDRQRRRACSARRGATTTTGIWVSDGCGGEFVAGQATQAADGRSRSRPRTSPTSGSCSTTARRARSISGSSATCAI